MNIFHTFIQIIIYHKIIIVFNSFRFFHSSCKALFNDIFRLCSTTHQTFL